MVFRYGPGVQQMHSRLAERLQCKVSSVSQLASMRFAYPIVPEASVWADVQFEHVDAVFVPVQTVPSASDVTVLAGARSGFPGSVRSVQLLEISTSSSARWTGALVGMAYLVTISATLSVALMWRIAWVCSLLQPRPGYRAVKFAKH